MWYSAKMAVHLLKLPAAIAFSRRVSTGGVGGVGGINEQAVASVPNMRLLRSKNLAQFS